jgi:hypothetical protein
VEKKERNEKAGGGVAIFIKNQLKYSRGMMVMAKLKCAQSNYILAKIKY